MIEPTDHWRTFVHNHFEQSGLIGKNICATHDNVMVSLEFVDIA